MSGWIHLKTVNVCYELSRAFDFHIWHNEALSGDIGLRIIDWADFNRQVGNRDLRSFVSNTLITKLPPCLEKEFV